MAPRLEERKQKQEWQESALIHLCFPRLVGCFLRCVSEWPFIRPPFWSLSALRLSQYIPRCLFIIPSSVFLFLLSDLSFSNLDLPPLSPCSVILRLTNQSVPTTAETSPVAFPFAPGPNYSLSCSASTSFCTEISIAHSHKHFHDPVPIIKIYASLLIFQSLSPPST